MYNDGQFGGVGSCHLDFDLAPYVKKSFIKHFKKGLKYLYKITNLTVISDSEMCIDNSRIKRDYPEAYNYAVDMLESEGKQGAESLFHNLNTLESRAGGQVPFTSINIGRDTSTEGRLVTRWMLEASIAGIGEFHTTSIFPISIFSYKTGVNANPGDPNYDLKQLALKSMSKRIYPNWVNGNWSQAHEDLNNPDTFAATMGCVDGEEIITYKIDNELFMDSFENMWNQVSELFSTHCQIEDCADHLYIDSEGVSIYDTAEKKFVNVKRIIRNTTTAGWLDVSTDERILRCTSDHPFHTVNRGRIYAKDLTTDDTIIVNHSQYSEDTLNFDEDMAWVRGVLCLNTCKDISIENMDTFVKTQLYPTLNLNCEELIELFANDNMSQAPSTLKTIMGKYSSLLDESEYDKANSLDYLYKIPNSIMQWQRSARCAFIAGIIDRIGVVYTDNGNSVVELTSETKSDILKIMAIAQSVNCPASITASPESNGKYVCTFVLSDDIHIFMVSNDFIKLTNTGYPSNTNKITHVQELTIPCAYSYDVETESDHFEVSGVYSHNCRTMVGYDRHGLGYSKVGRGNNVPITMILPKIAIECGTVLNARTEPDLGLFNQKFEDLLRLTEKALLERYDIMKKQSPKSAPFMYINGSIKDADKCDETVENSLRHNSLAFGFIGIAETCQALFGKNHSEDEEVHQFALSLVKRIYEFAQECSERNNLNFVCYATPAEGLCRTALKQLRTEYGVIPKVTDREYITNSFHVPVWEEISIWDKLRVEAPFTKFATGGTITYVELDSTFVKNISAVEKIIDYAFNVLDIPYLAFNFPIDTCMDCGYTGEFNDHCPECSSNNIEQLRRVTGYLTTDYSHFNAGKIAEVHDRVKHSEYTNFNDFIND